MKNLKGNIFTSKIARIVEKRVEHTVFLNQSQDDYDFEVSMSNPAYRSLHIKEGQMVNVAFKRKSIWLISEGDKDIR
jgi:hypothetical protein